jgi:hypothetical protein
MNATARSGDNGLINDLSEYSDDALMFFRVRTSFSFNIRKGFTASLIDNNLACIYTAVEIKGVAG